MITKLGFISLGLVLVLTFMGYLSFQVTTEVNLKTSQVQNMENNVSGLHQEIYHLQDQIHSTTDALISAQTEISLRSSHNKTVLHNPTSTEVKNFLYQDSTNYHSYTKSYTCENYATDFCNNCSKKGIRCAYVTISYPQSGHAIVAFQTTDQGILFYDPQTDTQAHLKVGSHYYECLDAKPETWFEAPSTDDTILSWTCYW